jgi:hypothetical protein
MLTDIAGRIPRSIQNFSGSWVLVVGVILLIVLIFVRVYGGGNR